MPFALEKFTPVHLLHLGVRAEMHGTDPVPAVDLKFRLIGNNDLLDLFDVGLKKVLYRKAGDEEEEEPELDGVEPVSNLTQLRSTSIAMPLHLIREYVGLNLVLDFGLGGKSNIELFGDADKFEIDAKEGGSVEVEWRFKASGIKGPALGKLGELVKHDVKITLLSSAAADNTQESVPGTKKFSATAAEPVKTATDLFVAGAAPAEPLVTLKRARDAARAAKFPSQVKKPAAKKAAKSKK